MSEDESLRRLRAADPAQGQPTDLAALRRAVDVRLGDEASDAVEPAATATDELAARRLRRSRRMSWIAGAAASVIVGVSGYLLGAGSLNSVGSGDSAGGDAEDAPAATSEEAESEAAGAAGASAEAEADGVTEQSAGGAEDSADTMLAGGRLTFVASGLSNEAGSAEAFAYDPSGIAGADAAAEIAQALGVAGDVEDRDGVWLVTDDESRTVELYDDGTATLSYVDPTLDPWACAVGVDEGSSPDDLGSCEPGPTPADPIGAAQEFLATVGVTDDLRLVAQPSAEGPVGVDAYTEGATSPAWTVTVTADGVYSAWGWLAPLVSLGSYDVVSPETAVDRLTDPRFGAQPSGMVTYEAADGGAADTSGAPTAVPEPGATLPWPVETQMITAAELTLVAYPLPGGALTLLPAWALSSDDGSTWTVLAVTDDALDLDARWD